MFSSILFKKLPLETGVSVVCLSPGVVLTNVVSISFTSFRYKCRIPLFSQKFIALNCLFLSEIYRPGIYPGFFKLFTQ